MSLYNSPLAPGVKPACKASKKGKRREEKPTSRYGTTCVLCFGGLDPQKQGLLQNKCHLGSGYMLYHKVITRSSLHDYLPKHLCFNDLFLSVVVGLKVLSELFRLNELIRTSAICCMFATGKSTMILSWNAPMAQIPKGRLVKGPYKPICRDCAINCSITVFAGWTTQLKNMRKSNTKSRFWSLLICQICNQEAQPSGAAEGSVLAHIDS